LGSISSALTTYSTNGNEIYQICLKTGEEKRVEDFLSPQALWEKTYSDQNDWRGQFDSIPFLDKSGSWRLCYYKEIEVKNTLEAIAKKKNRILLTLASGTRKTATAFQIAWKLFQTRMPVGRENPQPAFLHLFLNKFDKFHCRWWNKWPQGKNR
jgi:type I restriction enzyme R subunit